MATNGGGPTRPAIAGVDPRAVLYFAIFPNCLVSLHPDYVMLHTLWPRGAGRTEVICEWFFEPETMEREGFDGTDAVEFWDMVNRQDWEVCELSAARHRLAPATRPAATRRSRTPCTTSTGWSPRRTCR